MIEKTAEVKTALASGNTKPSALRARSYQLTLNDVSRYEDLMQYLTGSKMLDYLISCREVAPTTGHEHIHIYCHFSGTRMLKIDRCFGAHIEICRGSPKQNIAYIKKGGDIIDCIGDEPHQGKLSVDELRSMNVDDVDPHLYRIKKEIDEDARKTEEFMNMLSEIDKDELKGPDVVYITGPSGKGKTYMCYKLALKSYAKNKIGKITIENNFLSVVNPQAEAFVIEEFRPSQMKASNFLQMIDKYGYDAPIKGGHIWLRPKAWFIASIVRPNELYVDEEINQQFIRRITKIVDIDDDCV